MGCGAPPATEADPVTAAGTNGYGEGATGTDTEDLRGKSGAHRKPAARNDAGATACKDAGQAPSCGALLTSTFADPAWADFHTYRSEPAPLPAHAPAVATCCLEELTAAERTSEASHRWECCNVLGGGDSTAPTTPMFCTPWGPPVPPAMRALRRLEVA